jgi:hypothetical protein
VCCHAWQATPARAPGHRSHWAGTRTVLCGHGQQLPQRVDQAGAGLQREQRGALRQQRLRQQRERAAAAPRGQQRVAQLQQRQPKPARQRPRGVVWREARGQSGAVTVDGSAELRLQCATRGTGQQRARTQHTATGSHAHTHTRTNTRTHTRTHAPSAPADGRQLLQHGRCAGQVVLSAHFRRQLQGALARARVARSACRAASALVRVPVCGVGRGGAGRHASHAPAVALRVSRGSRTRTTSALPAAARPHTCVASQTNTHTHTATHTHTRAHTATHTHTHL